MADTHILQTKQTAVGSVYTAPFGSYVLTLWTGTDTNRTINFCKSHYGDDGNLSVIGKAPTSLAGFKSTNTDKALAAVEEARINGPTFVLGPSGADGAIVWVNASQQVAIQRCTLASADDDWQFQGDPITIPGSKAGGAPGAALGLQNGQPVLDIVWQDAGQDTMLFAQLNLAKDQPSTATRSLGEQCLGRPSLARHGGVGYMAWTGTDRRLNLGIDTNGGIRFREKVTFNGTTSSFGPSFVPFGAGVGYLVWAEDSGNLADQLVCQQVARNWDGDWDINPSPDCVEVIGNKMNVPASPVAVRDRFSGPDGDGLPALAIAFPDQKGVVTIASTTVDLSPIPVTQVVVA